MKTLSELIEDLNRELCRIKACIQPGDENIIIRKGIDYYLNYRGVDTNQERMDIFYLILQEIRDKIRD